MPVVFFFAKLTRRQRPRRWPKRPSGSLSRMRSPRLTVRPSTRLWSLVRSSTKSTASTRSTPLSVSRTSCRLPSIAFASSRHRTMQCLTLLHSDFRAVAEGRAQGGRIAGTCWQLCRCPRRSVLPIDQGLRCSDVSPWCTTSAQANTDMSQSPSLTSRR